MPMQTVPFADGTVTFAVPPELTTTVAAPAPVPALESWRAVHAALRAPLGCSPLADLVQPGMRVTIAASDATLASPDRLLVPPLCMALELAGVAKEDITILIATGLHRDSTPEEKQEKLGTEIVQRYKVIDHDASDSVWLQACGTGSWDIPLVVNRRAAAADLLIATGTVAPDLWCGLRGGATTLGLGCAGAATLHGLAALAASGAADAEQRVLTVADEAARCAGLRFVLNAVLNMAGEVTAVAAGAPDAVYAQLRPQARAQATVALTHPYDIVVAGIGWPYDLDLYQLSLTATRIAGGPVQLVRPGGWLILPAVVPEGGGQGVAATDFFKALTAPQAAVAGARTLGAFQAQRLLDLLADTQVVITGAVDPAFLQDTPLLAAPTVEAAIALATAQAGPAASLLILPAASTTILHLPG